MTLQNQSQQTGGDVTVFGKTLWNQSSWKSDWRSVKAREIADIRNYDENKLKENI